MINLEGRLPIPKLDDAFMMLIRQANLDAMGGRSVAVLGHQANLKETSKGKELAKLRLQVLEVVKQVMLVNPKRKL